MKNQPFVSIILPNYNEGDFIEPTLKSIFNNSYPLSKFEILIIDGMSTDHSIDIIRDYAKKYSNIKIFENHKRLLAPALNIGLKNAEGEIIVRLDAHSIMNKNYIENCVKLLQSGNADVVGGILINMPYDKSIVSRTISCALTSFFGVGNATHRTGIKSETQYVDSVPFGSFYKSLIDKIGYYNEKCPRSEDIEFYNRVLSSGRKIMISSKIIVNYMCNNTMSMIKRYFRNGGDVTQYYFRDGIKAFKLRHLIPFLFLCALILSFVIYIIHSNSLLLFYLITIYLSISIIFSLKMVSEERDIRFIFSAPLIYFILHITHGLGALKGIFVGLKK